MAEQVKLKSDKVEVDIKYPQGYKGKQYIPEGKITVTREFGEIYEKKKIGKITKD